MKLKSSLLTGLALSTMLLTSLPAHAEDPCKVVVCMWGKVAGENDSTCNSAIKDFFGLNAFKKKGRFDPKGTLDLRKKLLGKCEAADPEKVAKILSQFGRIRG